MDKPDDLLSVSPMDKPALPHRQTRTSKASDSTVDLMTLDPSHSSRNTHDSQLVGVPVSVSRGADLAGTSHHACLPNMELSIDVKPADATLGKRKRGRPARGTVKAPPLKKNKDEEDVCFICFDGGSLVLCDRR